MSRRKDPNILITGTPGTGKSSLAEAVIEQNPDLKLIDINIIAKENNCYSEYDKELECHIVNEEKLFNIVEKSFFDGGCIIDWHVCDAFPAELIDLVVVLRTDNTVLYDRLQGRKYNPLKLSQNIDSEIMEVILDDARNYFPLERIVELQSNVLEDQDTNVERIGQWLRSWREDNPEGVENS